LPATHLIVSMQVALLAASAAYLKSDFRASISGKGSASRGGGLAVHEEMGEDVGKAGMWGLPSGEMKRFAIAEKVGGAVEVPSRTMGRAVGAPLMRRGSLYMRDASQSVQEGVPVEGDLPSVEAGLADVGEEEKPDFEPVPNGVGYSITADSASHFDIETSTVVFSGNVALHHESFTLNAKRLVVHLDGEGGQMKQMVANGNVEVALLQGEAVQRFMGWSEEALFEPKDGSIVMRGWPRILGQGREHRAASAATKMTIFTKPSKMVTEGRAQTRILPAADGALPGLVSP